MGIGVAVVCRPLPWGIWGFNPAQDAWQQATHGLGITATLTFASTMLCLVVALMIVGPRLAGAARGKSAGAAAPQVLAALAALPDFVVAVIVLWFFP